ANFLLLDEPTNHLDMHSCDLLIESLNKYEGSFLLVSHDRYFISRTANKIWEIDDHKIREFKGTYEEWVDWKERNVAAKLAAANEKAREEKRAEPAAPPAATAPKSPAATPPRGTAAQVSKKPAPVNQGADAKKELQRQQRLFQQLEERVAELSKQKALQEASLGDPSTYSDKSKFKQTEMDYKKTSDELVKANQQYEELFEKIMELEKSL
ncbi:MAG TPA: ABC transporter ATP-binding protein, partial [Puia sp.]|nr:ABC transporter ATP-binding protein [Puia sp.]